VSATLPLAGRRILVTRPGAPGRALCGRLRRLGARAIAVPTITIGPPIAGGPLDRALRALDRYDWVVVTSANGARACGARARALGVDLRATPPRWAAVGPATAAVLRRAGIRVSLLPSRFLTGRIARELPDVAGRRLLLPRADIAPPDLAAILRARGAAVYEVPAYRTVLGRPEAAARLRRVLDGRQVDAVLFTSGSTVRGLMRMLRGRRAMLDGIEVACIGPVTAAAAAEAGLRPGIVARVHTIDGLLDALVVAARRRRTRTSHHPRPSGAPTRRA
jgi:uroporphyrinogen III methyltransferase/synthase